MEQITARTRADRAVDARAVLCFAESLSATPGHLTDAERIDLIAALEVLKCTAEGAQAVVTAGLDTSQREVAAARNVPAARQGQGIAHQVALARRESPRRGQRHLGLARILVDEMPHARRAACWGDHRVDGDGAGPRDRLPVPDRSAPGRRRRGRGRRTTRGDGGVRGRGGGASPGLRAGSPEASVARARKAGSDRTVTIRPAPVTMTWLTGHLPVKQGVAVYAALRAEADRLVAG